MKKLTVSELTGLIKNCLEDNFPQLSVEGEVSNFKPYSSGHLYFTLKDAGAVLSAVMFRNSARTLNFQPKDGKLVLATGKIQLYPPRGGYQLVVDSMEELSGTGDILAMLEKRKRVFAEEGLFNEERKRPIPRFPATVAVITSPTGAAIRDILQILSRRAPALRIIVLPSPVQGAEAAPVIARRVEQANFWRLADVLIVGRGGGSIEDLLPFSEEVVVRAVAASGIPVISAVGHEIDWALSDFAADLRAPTPSAAAELVSENHVETLSSIRYYAKFLRDAAVSRFERARLLLKPFRKDELEGRFRLILQPRLIRFDDAKESLLDALNVLIEQMRRRLEIAKTALEAASPLAILERGYSVVINTDTGRVVRGSGDVSEGSLLSIQPLEGRISARVETIEAGARKTQ
ncbi:MAG: exodeoxyribonuclease VII large subunit [Spirochaetaceae bacterium]|jgi:exodeoxyribonuclease VII large subunit|nr:exodeoxyribonuclease VII large subunit [Spirochaetaceae bacterium]